MQWQFPGSQGITARFAVFYWIIAVQLNYNTGLNLWFQNEASDSAILPWKSGSQDYLFQALRTNGPMVGRNPEAKSMADGSTFPVIINWYAVRGSGIGRRGRGLPYSSSRQPEDLVDARVAQQLNTFIIQLLDKSKLFGDTTNPTRYQYDCTKDVTIALI